MRVLIASDSHGDMEVLEEIVKKHPNIDIYLHAGDSEASNDLQLIPFRTVKGNCDYFLDVPDHLIIPSPLGNIWVQHHPHINQELIKKYKIKFFIHGHTHIRRHEEIDNVIIINPGSTTLPRDKSNGSYAILEINENNYKIKFYEIN